MHPVPYPSSGALPVFILQVLPMDQWCGTNMFLLQAGLKYTERHWAYNSSKFL